MIEPTPGDDELAVGILAGVGGAANIVEVERCTTRLRLVLRDPTLVHRGRLTALPGVSGIVQKAGQWQIVIGERAAAVNVALDLARSKAAGAERAPQSAVVVRPMNWLDRVFDLLGGTFQPLLSPLLGAGMVKTLLIVAVAAGWLAETSTAYAVWAAGGNAVFYFLPVFVGITAARKLGASPYVGGTIGAALLEPHFVGLGIGSDTTLWGLPLTVLDYSQSVFPAIFAAVLLAWLERWLQRMVPVGLHLLTIPALCLLLLLPPTVVVFGPLGDLLGATLASATSTLNTFSPTLTGALFAATFMLLVMVGMHWALIPVMLSNLEELGSDPLVAYMGAYNFAVFGIAAGVALRGRDAATRQVGFSASLAGLLGGVSEPAVYGIIVRYKRTLLIMLGASALGGAALGYLGVRGTVSTFTSVLTIPAFIPVPSYLLGISVAFTAGLLAVVALGYDSPTRPLTEVADPGRDSGPDGLERPERPAGSGASSGQASLPAALARPAWPEPDPGEVLSAMRGSVVDLASVDDPLFAAGMLGAGAAIRPVDGLVRAPVTGRIASLARTNHAIVITTATGSDVLIHVGIGTVALGGRHFTAFVGTGDEVRAGQPILHADLAAIAASGYALDTSIVLSGAGEDQVRVMASGDLAPGEPLLRFGLEQ
ncbi:MAG: glucose PTS transporter subunit IIA [Candidatus Nanopelagicales bacterium]